MTYNLKLYLIFSIIWSILFFGALNWGTAAADQRWPFIMLAAVIYGIGFAVLGRYLGKGDDQNKVRYGLKYAYSATSNITSAVIGSIWILFFRPYEVWQLAIYIPGVVIVAIIGIYDYKKSIKGMKAKELFK